MRRCAIYPHPGERALPVAQIQHAPSPRAREGTDPPTKGSPPSACMGNRGNQVNVVKSLITGGCRLYLAGPRASHWTRLAMSTSLFIMTLISTFIGPYGIIQAADSNLTGGGGTSEGKKLFPVGLGQAVLAVSGTYVVGTDRMDTWIPKVVGAYSQDSNPSLEGFAHFLGERLAVDATDAQKTAGTMIHIAGYAPEGNGKSHPEMWFVRNVESINPTTGDYEGRSDNFQVTEDFWSRDRRHLTRPAQGAWGQRYFNGFPPGRISFFQLTTMLDSFFHQIWTQPGWEFRQPNSLDELAELVAIQMETIAALFRISDYNFPYIGGPIQIEKIQAPINVAPL
jgi:hypothetical protein